MQAGQCGSQMDYNFWEVECGENGIGGDGKYYSVAAFVVNSEPRTGARPSARVCVWCPCLLALFITFPIAKSQTRNKNDTDTLKGGGVYN
jgi:hypothetical protein